MKRLILSSEIFETESVQASNYTNRRTYEYNGQKYSLYTKNEDAPEGFQFSITELHPYDDAEYAWAKKPNPSEVVFYKNGREVDSMLVPEWDEWEYDEEAYVDKILQKTCKYLYRLNKDVVPEMDRT